MKKTTITAQNLFDNMYRDSFYFCNDCLSPSVYNMKKDMIKCKNCGESYDYIWNGFSASELTQPIDKIGCELEGARHQHPKSLNRQDVDFHGDGSVHFDRNRDVCNECCCSDLEEDDDYDECYHCSGDCDCTAYNDNWAIVGEWVTKPIPFTRSFTRFGRIVEDSYPEGVNDTCGGHFHVSYKNELIYGMAMDQDMYEGLCSHLQSWARRELNKNGELKMKRRLEGSSNYCRVGFNPEQQMYGNADRYLQLNYAYGKHGTMECRILPMFDSAEVYVKAVKEATSYIEDWLKTHMIQETPKAEIYDRDINGQINLPDIMEYKQTKKSMSKRILQTVIGHEEI
jgi:hypothetical protein